MLWKYLVKFIKSIPAILKFIGKWIIDAIKESIAQIFTLLGFFILVYSYRNCTRYSWYSNNCFYSYMVTNNIYERLSG